VIAERDGSSRKPKASKVVAASQRM
jgi:hypothetical protein